MLNEMESLYAYKKGIINLAATRPEVSFLESSFTRWYLAAIDGTVLPERSIVVAEDLHYANRHKNCRFNVQAIMAAAEALFKKLFSTPPVQGAYPNRDHLVNAAQLRRLRDIYRGEHFEEDKNKLISIYDFIGMNTIHLSVPPLFADAVELFGSPLNTRGRYCSPFAFESVFGSLGSFFKFNLSSAEESLFIMNPPYDEVIINAAADRLLSQLAAVQGRPQSSEAGQGKTVLITLPVWDSASQQRLGIRDYKLPFAGFDALIKSAFFKERDILSKEDYPYWDYYKERYIPATFTHLIILATGEPSITLAGVKQTWLAEVAAFKKERGLGA